MYQDFFEFKERPFKLVPDPAYFFMSRSHEEALAHLRYAISAGDGFAVITGEVGTGKTTLCRYFLDHVEDTIETAYIFNPKLSPKQLLLTILEEFGISYQGTQTKDLLDPLNVYLMQKKEQGKHLVVLIDEAQQLEKKVLELLRLLSNLETHKSKLLQIILVGQPELREVLESHELRQLDQRINLRWHLTPLRSHEVQNYVKHRIAVASNHARVHFTKGAYRAIYQYSNGIPRLVNIVCDRSLITAFSREQKKITRSIVQTSILELSGRGNIRQFKRRQWLKVVLPISLAGLVALSILLYRLEVFDAWLPVFSSDPSAAIPAAKSPGVHDENRPGDQSKRGLAQAPTLLSTEQAFSAHLKSIDAATSPQVALKKILQEWNIDARIDPAIEVISDAGAFFRLASKNHELQVQRLDADLALVGRLNHPAILEMTLAAAEKTVYLAINKMLGNTLSLYNGSGDSTFELPMDLVAKYYSGVAYVFWKDFLSYRGTIPLTAPKESVITLKMHLKDIGYRDLPIDSKYDAETRSVVRQIQKKYGLVQDGIVGSMTKIALYNEKETLAIPRLSNGVDQQGVN